MTTSGRSWPEAVERVVSVLREAKVEARVEEFGEGTPTAAAAAAATGAPIESIVKSLVFAGDGRPIVVMVPGDSRADTARVAPGGVAPFPLPGIETILIEQALFGHEIVWIGAGSRRHMAALAPNDLARLARARPAPLTVE